MPGNPNEIKLVNNAMSNATRRKIMNFLSTEDKSTEEIGGEVGKTMLDFHLKLLQQASLIEIEEGTVKLSEYGKNFLKEKEEKDADKIADLSQAKPPFCQESELCLKLAARSGNVRLYLVGNGVYHLLSGIQELPGCTVYACQEDLEARAIRNREKVIAPNNFYAVFIEDMMEHCKRAYTF